MIFSSFLDYLLLEKNYSALTVNAYKKDLQDFSGFIIAEYSQDTLQDVNYSQIRRWIVSLVEGGMSNRSVNRKISALNSYYKFLMKIGDLDLNPLAKHKALKIKKNIQIPFSEKEMESVLDNFPHEQDFEGLRNRLIIELFYSTGINV